MKITLGQLNESYSALVKLAQMDFPKEQHKLAYKLSRVVKTAKSEIEALAESLTQLQERWGLYPGKDIEQGSLASYNHAAKDFMASTYCDLWGDPIKLDEIAGVVAITPFDLALLDWLIIEEEQTTAAKAATT